jgi:hypothetical protein
METKPNPQAPRAPRAPKSLRLAVWALACALGFAAFSTSSLKQSADTANAERAAFSQSAVVVAANTEIAIGPQSFAPQAPTTSSACNVAGTTLNAGQEWTLNSARQQCVNLLVDKFCPSATKCDPDHFLPMNRWRDQLDTLLVTNTGWFSGVSTSIQSSMGSFFMSIAILIWSLISTLAGFSARLNLLTGEAGARINDMFLVISDAITQSGLVALVIALALFTVIRQVFRWRGGAAPGIFTTMLTLLLPLGLLAAVTTGANKAGESKDGKTNASSVVMSPLWLATTGSNLAAIPASAINLGIDETANEAFGSDRYSHPSCYAYTQVLTKAYEQSWKRKYNDDSALAGLQAVNMLWNEAFLTFYNNGQFQNTYSGSRITCHILDGASVSPLEQAIVGAAAGYPAPRKASEIANAFKTSASLGDDKREIAPYFDMSADFASFNKRAYLMHWGACVFKGDTVTSASSWYIDPAWGSYDDKLQCHSWYQATHDAFTKTGSYKQKLTFEGWSSGKMMGRAGEASRVANYEKAIATGAACTLPNNTNVCLPGVVNGKSMQRETISGAGKTIAATASGSVAGWIFSGLMALLTALLYAYVLGGLFGGLMIAKIGAGLLLALLPGILLLVALPTKQGRPSSPGMKLLKTLIGWMATAAIISVMISLFVLVISVIRSLLGSDRTGFMFLISPIVSMYFVHFLMKSVGMGSLISTNPASTFAASAGLAVGSAKAASSGRVSDMKKGSQGLNKVRDAGSKWQQKNHKSKQRREQVRNKARKTGSSYGDMKRNDADFARWDSSSSKAESLVFAWSARRGQRDAAGKSRRSKADRGETLAEKTKQQGRRKLRDAKDATADTFHRERARKTKDERSERKKNFSFDKKKTIDDFAHDAEANQNVKDVAANADILAGKASTKAEADARTDAGSRAVIDKVGKGQLSEADSKDLEMTRNADIAKNPKAYRAMIEAERAESLGLVDSSGGLLVASSTTGVKTSVMGFDRADDKGAMVGSVASHSDEFVAVAAEARRLQAAGNLTDSIVMPTGSAYEGQRYQVSSEMRSMGAEGRTSAQVLYAQEMGVQPRDVITNAAGTMIAVSPAAGDRAYHGTRLTVASSPDQLVEVARSPLQHLPPNVVGSIAKLPPHGQQAAYEVLLTHFSEGGQSADALALMNVSESAVKAAHAAGPEAVAALFENKQVQISPALQRAALAEGYAAKSAITADSTSISAVSSTAHTASRSMNQATDLVERLGPLVQNLRPAEDPAVQQRCFEEMMTVYEHVGVVQAAALVCDSAASGSMDVDSDAVASYAQQRSSHVATQRAAFAGAGNDPAARTRVLQDIYKDVATKHLQAEQVTTASIERVAESVDISSRAGEGVKRSVRRRVNPRFRTRFPGK